MRMELTCEAVPLSSLGLLLPESSPEGDLDDEADVSSSEGEFETVFLYSSLGKRTRGERITDVGF